MMVMVMNIMSNEDGRRKTEDERFLVVCGMVLVMHMV